MDDARQAARATLRQLVVAAIVTTALVIALATLSSSTASASSMADERVRYDNHSMVRVHLHSEADQQFMDRIAVDILSCSAGCWHDGANHVHDHVHYLVHQDSIAEMREAGLHFDVQIENIQAVIDAERIRIAQREADQPAGNADADADDGQMNIQNDPANDPFYDDYQRYEAIDARLDVLADLRPDLTEIIDLGDSLEGRPIRAIRITAPNGNDKPGFLINSLQHAREWAAGSSGIYIAETLVTQYGIDPFLTSLVDTVDFYIVPVVNPDGYVHSWDVDRLWRKNRRNNGDGSFGVDLNRNWGVGWGGPGSSGNPSSGIYRGTGPFSEPETAAMRDFVLSRPNLVAHIDIHTFSQIVLQPWGYTTQLPPDHEIFDELGGRMADAMESLYGSTYVHGPGALILYIVSGGSRDWTYGDQGLLGFGFELRDTGQFGFLLPPDQIIPCAEEALAGVTALADAIRRPLLFVYPDDLPSFVEPNTPTPIDVQIGSNRGNAYEPGTARVYYREAGEPSFQSAFMTDLGGGAFEATIEGSTCGSVLEYYFEAQTTDGTIARDPVLAPETLHAADILEQNILFADTFNTDQGWSVNSVNLTDGPWERAIPAGFNRGDPATDYDGSGWAFVTDNAEVNSDVDGGPTYLISPVFDFSSSDPIISYARWFSNDDNDADRFETEVSNDGGQSWTLVESVGHTGEWNLVEFRLSDYVAPTSTVRVRFSAVDNPNNSITEAAVDAITIATFGCDLGSDMTLAVGSLTAGEIGQFDVTNATPNTATYLAYSLIGIGSTFVPPLNIALDLASPQQAGGPRTSDSNGAVAWQLPIPGNAAGRDVWFQACQVENVSNVVATSVQ
ncbi:MAG: M14 family zinc carboxypeptidase [Planctomycetota bacterium]